MNGNNHSQDRCFHSKPHEKGNDHLATKTILSAEEKVIKADTYGHTSSLWDS